VGIRRSGQALVLLTLAVASVLLLVIQPDEEPALRVLVPSPVLVSRATQVDLQPVEAVSGHLQPVRRAWLHFEVDGRVAVRAAEPGQRVEPEQVLLSLEDEDYRDALIQAQTEVSQAEESLARDRRLLKHAERSRKLQEEEVARLNSLGERSLASKTRLGDSAALLAQRQSEEARLKSSVAIGPQQVAARQAGLSRAKRNLDRTRLRAPFAGRINQVQLEVGDYAARNQPALEVISDQLDFYAQIRGALARALRIGQTVKVDVQGTIYTATVASIQPDPDPQTFTHAIRLRMPEDETRSGSVAVAHLPRHPLTDVLIIPVTAVLMDGGQAYVFHVRDELLARMPVVLGPRVDQQQVIIAGLSAGDAVVVRDVAALSDGQAVVSEMSEPVIQD
jgi:RND family efflux transporter MFP subunit